MADFFDEIITDIRRAVKAKYPEASVLSDYPNTPVKYPTVTVDLEQSLPVFKGGSNEIMAHDITISIGLYTEGNGRKKQARELLQPVEGWLTSHNFTKMSDYTRSDIYQSTVHTRIVRYHAAVDSEGRLYRNFERM